MAGIQDIAVYVPRHRVDRDAIARAHGKTAKGSQPVAYFDEDAITMAAAACFGLETGGSGDALFFAASRPPYQGIQSADVLAQVVGMPADALAEEFGTSARGGTRGLHTAFQMLAAGEIARPRLVAAEHSLPRPGSEEEAESADLAVAVTLSREARLAEYLGSASFRSGVLEKWLLEGETFPAAVEARFASQHGVEAPFVRAVTDLLQKTGVRAADVKWAALAAPGLRSYRKVLKIAGLAGRPEMEKAYAEVGHCGVAMPLVLLYQALRHAEPGELVVVGGVSGGADVLLFRVAPGVRALQGRPSAFEGPTLSVDYLSLLKIRKIVPAEELVPVSSPVQAWRERKDIGLVAQKCEECGAIQYPRRRVCRRCSTKDRFADFPLAREGVVFTHTTDHLFPSPHGNMVTVVVDLAGGGRVFVQATDLGKDGMRIGMPVELCLRRLHQGGGFNNYFWKARPRTGEGAK